MYLLCRLPSGAGGMAAAHASNRIGTRLKEWIVKNGNPTYQAGPEKGYNYTIRFEDERYYSLFMLTFKNDSLFSRFDLIDDQII